MRTRVGLAAILLTGAILAVVAPLATYSITLAAFGLPHVLAELRYVDQRYAGHAPRNVVIAWAGLLVVVVVGRMAVFAGVADRMAEAAGELAIIGVLAYTAWGLSAERPALLRIAASAVASMLGLGALLAPAATMVTLSVLHNLTPLGFLADAARPRDVAVATAALLGIPALIATGLPAAAVSMLGSWDADPLRAGALVHHLPVYVPAAWLHRDIATDLFRAAVFGQWAHYVFVIGVLPALSRAEDRAGAWLPWPTGAVAIAAVVALTAPQLGLFAHDFVVARSTYGWIAAVHAWIEIPVLLWVLGGPLPRARVAQNSPS